MNVIELEKNIIKMLKVVFAKNKDIEKVVLFGSRAKGTARNNSDIDIAIFGIENQLEIEAIAMELEELPLPYKFDVKQYCTIKNATLRKHIDRVGIVIYDKLAEYDQFKMGVD